MANNGMHINQLSLLQCNTVYLYFIQQQKKKKPNPNINCSNCFKVALCSITVAP